ncbi:hypothetical protein GCM10009796_17120 [Microbacterium koreense]|uniref:rhodanese-like domain-containing protein n=1 Tax=Microbacterium koreense TaxID=323761 RepID=UPI00337CF073
MASTSTKHWLEFRSTSGVRDTAMRRHSPRWFAALGTVAVLTAALAGCATGASPSIPITDETVVVDVRTTAEYSEGHLEGAVNIDLQDPGFAAAVAELDDDVEYVVYCRSGNRSAQAASVMQAEALQVIDAGGFEDAAAATGLAVVP